ncbi:MAG: hypothetical protein HRU70_00910 [Phycisphaeraceae bacterium]|nr:MAG: hypothetical protein HRU70_00910 [Phycisphaeraceae bacterium]
MKKSHWLVALAAGAACSFAWAGDECSAPTVIVAGVPASGSTVGATSTPGIPAAHCAGTSELGPDNWYTFTAPANENYVFSLCGSTYDTALSLWSACPDGALLPLACNDDFCGLQSQLTRAMTAGETILIRVGGFSAAAGNYTLSVSGPTPPPANDDCANAIAVGLGSTSGSTISASNDGSTSCVTALSPDVWYTFTAPASTTYAFDTCASPGFDTVLSAYDQCGGTELACNDDMSSAQCAISGLRSRITLDMTQDQTVVIRVGAFGAAVTGAFVLNVSEVTPPPPPPANDDCANAVAIADGDTPINTVSATGDGTPTNTGCGIGSSFHNDVWFVYEAACNGTVTVSTCDASYDTIIAAYGADCPTEPDTAIVCDDDGCDSPNTLASRMTFAVTAGQSYLIRVGSFSATGRGTATVTVATVCDEPTCPADFNDDGFLDFFDLDAYVACFEGTECPEGKDADFNGDGFVDFFDLDAYTEAFENGCDF